MKGARHRAEHRGQQHRLGMAPRSGVGLARTALSVTLVATAGGVLLAGCGGTGSGANGPGTNSPSASASVSAAPLTSTGQARSAVTALLRAAGTDQAVKVSLTSTRATLTIVRNGKPATWAWSNGVVAPADSDIEDVEHLATFDPRDYAFDDLAGLFRRAASASGSTSRQQLQIVEYNQGQVLMTVTTDPESATVFFRADGTLVNTVDLGTAAGIAEALRDAVGTHTSVVQVSYDPKAGLSVQVPGSRDGTVDQTTRPPSLPRWTSTLKASTHAAFDPALVKPEVIATLLARLRTPAASASASGRRATPQQPDVAWTIDRRDTFAHQPLLRFMTSKGVRDYTLDGDDITTFIGGQ